MLRSLVRNSLHSVRSAMDKTQELAKNRKISAYVKGGKRPWTEGYLPFRDACINSVIHDQTMQEALLNRFLYQKNTVNFWMSVSSNCPGFWRT